jgi:hypothetical protein
MVIFYGGISKVHFPTLSLNHQGTKQRIKEEIAAVLGQITRLVMGKLRGSFE